ncbi:MAG: hypothetical protein WC054_00240 [Candidatus Nanopelagicales bacterium]
MASKLPRLFHLVRAVDHTGLSGTGVVGEGILFTDGRVALRWIGEHSSVVLWNDIESVIAIHGHNGSTEVIFLG